MSKPTILVVEDDDAARAGLANLLQPEGYDVVAEPDGTSALNRITKGLTPALILLDMIVPGLDGWQFLGLRHTDRELAAIPVVIMTGLGVASEEWAASLGASQLLRKPIDVDSLLDAVRRHVTQWAAPLQDRPVGE